MKRYLKIPVNQKRTKPLKGSKKHKINLTRLLEKLSGIIEILLTVLKSLAQKIEKNFGNTLKIRPKKQNRNPNAGKS